MATLRQTKTLVALATVLVLTAATFTGLSCLLKEYRKFQFLYEAVGSGDLLLARAFLNQGMDVNARGRWRETPLMLAAEIPHAELTRLLLDAGAEVNAQDDTGQCALLAALFAFQKDQPQQWPQVIETIKLLKQAGARNDLPNGQGVSPRLWAEKRAIQLKQFPNFYAPFKQRGMADPTQMVQALNKMILADDSPRKEK